ncbi:hypothetical protein E1B28_004680 [Marasmius oreades]|uniref:SGNH hydrolase-type esterase domain-containing protein n=1 Tax=Marasmius oreades TaxID=181124 RepID=A0A9P7UZ75_9AGAR|nr:uncharacterized protein E1B28_004680 [Marasmius oreades]KAG7097321.1 hypothetical protein E1B28_004680 [Marasmius oreades]
MRLSQNHLFFSLSTYIVLTSAVSLPTSFILTGDSTTAVPSGWGNGFCGSSTPAIASSLETGTPCFNVAVGGATTGSFVNQGHWKTALDLAKAEVAKGRRTLVTIQFGHNDRWVGTPDLLAQHLTPMVQQVKEIKAEPILITSLVVRTFDSTGKKIIEDTLAPYVAATIQVAENEKTHLLDLHEKSLTYCEAIGVTAANKFNPAAGDTTHVNQKGMVVFGRMVADLMNADFGLIGINLLPIVPNPELSYNITHGIPSY